MTKIKFDTNSIKKAIKDKLKEQIVTFKCPECKKPVKVKLNAKRTVCPSCKKPINVSLKVD